MFSILTLTLLVPVPTTADRIDFGTIYAPPYSSPGHQGILEQVLREALEPLRYDVRLLRLPAERSLQDANSGTIDGDVARIEGLDRLYPNLVRVPSAIVESRDFAAFTRSKVAPIPRGNSISRHSHRRGRLRAGLSKCNAVGALGRSLSYTGKTGRSPILLSCVSPYLRNTSCRGHDGYRDQAGR